MSFDTNKLAIVQEHFSVIEIDLPAFTSGCTVASGTAFYTPLTCDETWDGTTYETYRFSTANLPRTFGRPPSSSGMPAGIIDTGSDPIHPVVQGINETVTELQPGKGLAIQGSAKITLVDFVGDPGPVTTTTTGTYFGKLQARNILTNKDARIKHFHINSDGIYEEDDALVRYYLIDSLINNGKGRWSLSLKDELSKLDKGKTQFPIPTGGTVRGAVTTSTDPFPVDVTTDWTQTPFPYTVKVGDELLKVTGVTDNMGTATTLTIGSRGGDIVYSNTLSITVAAAHADGDDVQICYTSDDQDIDRLLQDVAYSAGLIVGDYGTDEGTITLIVDDLVEVEAGHSAGGTVGNVYKSITATGSTDLTAEDYSVGAAWEDLGEKHATIADWKEEITTWHAADKINTIWHEPRPSNDVVKQICNDFLLDMWADSEDREIKLSAISVWKVPGVVVEQGKGINRDSFNARPKPNNRYSRAFVYWNKPNKVSNDDIENYRNLSININTVPEAAGFYGEPKTKEFSNSHVLGSDAADLLTQRYTARFGQTPNEYSWTTEEKFLTFKTGDIATIITSENQNSDGSDKEERAQILSVQPVYSPKNGRNYKVKAMTFEPAYVDGDALITISSSTNDQDISLLFGAPTLPDDFTVVIDGTGITSNGSKGASLFAGALPSGSTITLILINSADLSGIGGTGGAGGTSTLEPDVSPTIDNGFGYAGSAGGIVYDAQGIDTDIYLGGSISGYTALGTISAPGGGGGGEDGQGVGGPGGTAVGGDGGGGGAGINGGGPGAGGVAVDNAGEGGATDGVTGSNGASGETVPGTPPPVASAGGGAAGGAGAGAGGGIGDAGNAGTSGSGGAAGKGIVKNGATVNVYTSGNSGRFINGGGDTPDATT